MRYAKLGREQQEQIVGQRLLELEAKHYRLELNKHRVRALADSQDEAESAIAQIEAEKAALDTAHAAEEAELAKLKDAE